MPARQEHAAVVVQLARWSTELGLEEAIEAVWAPDFLPERAAASDPVVSKLLTFGETVGTLVNHQLLDRDLVLGLWRLPGVWAKVGPAALRRRGELAEPHLFENFEALVAP